MKQILLLQLLSILLCWPLAAQKKADIPAALISGKYHCVFFISGHLQTTPGFTILSGGKYQHDGGSKGSFAFDAAKSLITFDGGGLDKQAGRVDNNDKLGIIRIYNERRSRTVIDCDTPRP